MQRLCQRRLMPRSQAVRSEGKEPTHSAGRFGRKCVATRRPCIGKHPKSGTLAKHTLDGARRSAVLAAKKVALALAILRKAAFEQARFGSTTLIRTAFFGCGHLIEFWPPFADMAAGGQTGQFEGFDARARDLRHFLCSGRRGRNGKQCHHACSNELRHLDMLRYEGHARIIGARPARRWPCADGAVLRGIRQATLPQSRSGKPKP